MYHSRESAIPDLGCFKALAYGSGFKRHPRRMIKPFKLSDIRPCSRTIIKIREVSVGAKILINYDIKHPGEAGLWYDFVVDEVPKLRKRLLKGKLLAGDVMTIEIPVRILGDVYAVEENPPPQKRNKEYKKLMKLKPPLRARAVYCIKCQDQQDVDCNECGCCICSKKINPEKILLCDECNKGFHMSCLEVPLSQVPDGDWFCPSCKRNAAVARGAVQKKKTKATTKDGGRGMACVGKTKTCAMPEDHFGPIPGIEVGMSWLYRKQVSEAGVHRPPGASIHGRSLVGAFSVVVSGAYENDMDNGDEVLLTGIGGRDLSGNKRTAPQCRDQTFDRENRSMAYSCAAPPNMKGGDAGDNWREGKPTRLIRAYKMKKNFPKYAPPEGYRYDGIYKVVKYFPEKGRSGFFMWRFLLRRDDPAPAPWEPHAKQFQLVRPKRKKAAAKLREKALKKAAKITKGQNQSQVPKEDNPREPVKNDPNQAEEEVQPPKTKNSKPENNESKDSDDSSAKEHPQKPPESTLPGSSEPQAASVSNSVDCDDSTVTCIDRSSRHEAS